MQGLSLSLHERLMVEACPTLSSVAGRSRGGDPKNLVKPFKAAGMTVEKILNTALANSTGGLWMAILPPRSREACVATGRFWAVLEYSDPAMENALQAGRDSRLARSAPGYATVTVPIRKSLVVFDSVRSAFSPPST